MKMYLGRDLKFVEFVIIKNGKKIKIVFIGDKFRLVVSDVEGFFV